MKFIDLFAGIGGFRYGLEATNALELRRFGQEENKLEATSSDSIGQSNKRQLAYRCVYSNEWRVEEQKKAYIKEKGSIKGFQKSEAHLIYKKHYGECDTRDIRTIKPSSIPKHDLICGGFPCQSFSIAGKRKGFGDTRGTLFYEILRIARFHRTPYLLLENVKGLLNHDQGQTFSVILESLDELGYDCQWQVLNSKNFGVPQNRERVFIVGHLRGESRPKVFPITRSYRTIAEIRDKNNNKRRNGGNSKGKNRGAAERREVSKTIRAGGRGSPKGSKQEWDIVGGIRRLTPIECERLQGFEDGWTEGISDTQRYKCLGNAVTTNVVEAIGKKLCGKIG